MDKAHNTLTCLANKGDDPWVFDHILGITARHQRLVYSTIGQKWATALFPSNSWKCRLIQAFYYLQQATSYRTMWSPHQPREGGQAHPLEARDEGHLPRPDEVADLSSREAFYPGSPSLLHGWFPEANKGRKTKNHSQHTTRHVYYLLVPPH